MLVFFDIQILSLMVQDTSSSPEELLSSLESALDTGELSIEEVTQFLNDYNRRSR